MRHTHGHIYTSAGVTAGMDLALALVEEDFGREIALHMAREVVLDLRRPGGQSQFSTLLRTQESRREPLRALQTWIVEHVDADLSKALLRNVALSVAGLTIGMLIFPRMTQRSNHA